LSKYKYQDQLSFFHTHAKITLAMTHPYIQSALRTLDIESSALLQLKSFVNENFVAVVDLFCAVRGRVIVMGMGKSGLIGRKIAATLSSTGTPAFFVHPAEASHGDLGMITAQDVVLAISNSGEVDELSALLPHLKRMKIPIVALTSSSSSTLGMQSDYFISTHVAVEACPHNLAPTASTTAQLAMGDAIAVACLESKGFQVSDFAASHPGGSLGRRLLTRVSDVMRTGSAIPFVYADTSFLSMMEVMSTSGLGFALLTDLEHHPIGIFTDGDLRRELMLGSSFLHQPITGIMRKPPRTILVTALAVDAVSIMESERITSIVAVDSDGHIMGVLNSNDLLRAKVI
jgi:arabinose-5-phosphate isomerase